MRIQKDYAHLNKIIYLLLPILILLILIQFKLVNYYANDDFLLNILSMGGNTGTPNAHLIFINYIIGNALKIAYDTFPGINWCGILYLLCVIVSTYLTFFVLSRYMKNMVAFTFSVLVELFMTFFLTFTVMAYMCMGIGLIALIECTITEMKGKKKLLMVLAVVCTFTLGFMVRKGVFLSVIALGMPLFVFCFKDIDKKMFLRITLLMAAFLGIAVLTEHIEYDSDFWKDFAEYNTQRSSMGDYPMPIYDNNIETYQKIGISKNDYECINNLIFADKEVFSADVFKQIAAINTITERYNFNPINIILGMTKLKETWIFFFVMIAFILMAAKKTKIYLLMEGFLTYAMIAAVFFRNRPVLRVISPVYMLGILFMLMMFIKDKQKITFQKRLIGGASAIVMCIVLVGCYFNMALLIHNIYQSNNEKYGEVRQYIKNRAENLYVAPGGEMWALCDDTSVLDIDSEKTGINLVSLGNWDTFNNIYYDIAAKYKFQYSDRLIINIAENENILLISSNANVDNVERIKKYIEEHTGKVVNSEIVDTIDETDIKVYNMTYK